MAMASALTTINNTTLEDIVRCAICLDYYNDPRLLPCSHTFCYKCMKDLCKDGPVQCPMRDNMTIHRNMINQLPINRIAKDFVDCISKTSQLKSSSSQTKCGHCKQILSEFICKTCTKNYCTLCLKLEHNIDQFKSHVINIISNENSNHFCPEHIEEKQKYWCQLCQEIVCSDCLLFKHKQHPFNTLQDIAQETKTELHLSIQQLNLMKENLEKLNEKSTEAYQAHDQTYMKTRKHIEQIINDLQTLLEERKKHLIKTITEKELVQQRILRQEKYSIEEHLKIVLIRELFAKQLLNIEDSFQLVQMKNDLINYNRLIQEQYEQLMQGCIFDLQYFTLEGNLSQLKQQLEDLGIISTETFLTNTNHIQPLLKLSQLSGEEKYQVFEETYAYGYRLNLTTPFKLNAVKVKVALFNTDLTVYILDHNDFLIQKEMIKRNEKNSQTFQWFTIPITCEMQHNYYIFIATRFDEESIPLIAYRDSTHSLRQINPNVSVRSKRAQINNSENIDINTKFKVLYDALLSNDERNQTTVPAIEMMLDV